RNRLQGCYLVLSFSSPLFCHLFSNLAFCLILFSSFLFCLTVFVSIKCEIKSNKKKRFYITSIKCYFSNTEMCTHKVLQCYMLELKVIFQEEKVDINKTECILIFDERLEPEVSLCRHKCEVYPLENSTTFYNKFKGILESLTSEKNPM
uniref:Interleukin n=1 Tax=Fundulus heteroclitus TaxID=8078 RepID=A0A3Q2TJ57_FUNHE